MPIDERAAMHRQRSGLHQVRRWALWSIPKSAWLYMLLIEGLAVAGTITLLVTRGGSQTDVVRVAVLAALAIGSAMPKAPHASSGSNGTCAAGGCSPTRYRYGYAPGC